MTKTRKLNSEKGPERGRPESQNFRVAIAQFAPVYLDKAASLALALQIVQDAKERGAELVAFGETWLPGYPAWLDVCPDVALWEHLPTKQVFARLRQNSVTIPGPEITALCEAAGDLKINVVIGVNERVEAGPGNGTLYNSLLTVTSEAKLANHHRKLVPTHTERLVWGQGDGQGLSSVTTKNGRIGGLICWEHWMPLARMAMHNSGEHIHVAVWPTAHELHQLCSRHYAFEGRCFVLAVGLMMPIRDLPSELQAGADIQNQKREWLERGGSAIVAPGTRYIVEPVYDREELIVADLNLSEIDQEFLTLDVSGHYSRPDVFTFDTKAQ
jgi:predicted amidohydrolase